MNNMKTCLMSKGHSAEKADSIIGEILDDAEEAVECNDMNGIEEALRNQDLDPDFEFEVLEALMSR